MNSQLFQPSPIPQSLQRKDSHFAFLFCIIGLVSLLIGILYSIITFKINYDPLLIGFTCAFGIPVILLAVFLAGKKKLKNYKILIFVCVLSTFVAFGSRIFTRSYLTYHDVIISTEKDLEIAEGSYVSDYDVQKRVDELLKLRTNFGGYVGAFLWDLENSEVTTDNYGQTTTDRPGFIGNSLYLFGEFALCLWIVTIGLQVEIKKRPQLGLACENCDNIKTADNYLIAASDKAKNIIKLFKQGNFEDLKHWYNPKEATKNNFVGILVYTCPYCLKPKTKISYSHENISTPVEIVVVKNGARQPKQRRFSLNSQQLKDLQSIVTSQEKI